MNCKMIAMDRDRTLFTPTGKIPQKTLQILEKLTLKNIYVVIVTGGSLDGVKKKFFLNGYSVGSKGYPHVIIANPYIYYLENGEYHPDENWNNDIDNKKKRTKNIIKNITDDLVQQICDSDFERIKFGTLIFKNEEKAHNAETLAGKKVFSKKLSNITVERNRTALALRDSRLRKGHTLCHLADKLNITPKEIVAIGDSGNDISILDKKLGFFPACPANAEEKIKRVVKEKKGIIAKSKYGEGVREIISEIVLN